MQHKLLFLAILGLWAFWVASSTRQLSVPVSSRAYIFVHAAVGKWRRGKRKNYQGYYGFGGVILKHLLLTITNQSDLGSRVNGVFITLVGSVKDRSAVKQMLQIFNSSTTQGGDAKKPLAGKIHVVFENHNIYLAEFPAMHVIQRFASERERRPKDKILYLHTKGVRDNGEYGAHWRDYLVFFLVEQYSLCWQALRLGYYTCGAQLARDYEQYDGNMWWSTADWIRSRNVTLKDVPWDMAHRHLAEDFLLAPAEHKDSRRVSEDSVARWRQHYCLVEVHHNLYDCPTPRSLYSNVTVETVTFKHAVKKDHCAYTSALRLKAVNRKTLVGRQRCLEARG